MKQEWQPGQGALPARERRQALESRQGQRTVWVWKRALKVTCATPAMGRGIFHEITLLQPDLSISPQDRPPGQ